MKLQNIRRAPMITIILLTLFILSTLILYGCETEKYFTTVMRMNPNGTVEQWKTCDTVTWAGDGSVEFKPMRLSHSIRITGNMTVFKTKVIVETKEEKQSETEPEKEVEVSNDK